MRRVERICAELDIEPRGKKCMGMDGLVEEGKEVMTDAAAAMGGGGNGRRRQ